MCESNRRPPPGTSTSSRLPCTFRPCIVPFAVCSTFGSVAFLMAPINPLVSGYIAVKLAQGKYDKLSSVNLDLPGPDSLITQRLIEEALSLVHQQGRDLDTFISFRLRTDRSQNDISVTLGHLEPHARPVDPAVCYFAPRDTPN